MSTLVFRGTSPDCTYHTDLQVLLGMVLKFEHPQNDANKATCQHFQITLQTVLPPSPYSSQADSVSIAASDDSRAAPSEASTTNLTVSSQRSSGAMDNPQELLFAAIVKYSNEDGRAIAPTFTCLPSKKVGK